MSRPRFPYPSHSAPLGPAAYGHAAGEDRPPTGLHARQDDAVALPREASAPRAGRPGRHRRSGREAPIFAALDLGTNNCRLLLARPTAAFLAGGAADPCCGGPAEFAVVDAFSRIVRLGEGLAAQGALSRAAMDRALDALKVCAGKIRRRPVAATRLVATEACRRAANGEAFVARVRAETGLAIEIIGPREEAALALAGVAPLLDAAVPEALVFDIGGGSTELMWAGLDGGGAAVLRDSMSLPFGVMNLSERADCACLTPADFERIVARLCDHTEAFEARHSLRARIAQGRVQMLGSSGTVTTLAGIRMGLACYDRARVDGCRLGFADIRAVTARLLSLDCAARAAEPCVGPSRADLLLAGCAILEAICRTWPVGSLRVADRGVREGILLTLMRAHRDARPAAVQ